ncbi:hypothetical protein COU37_02020 [Candidatus Micrarchaeota archaeon CG10_big_fil_rev_8_21_14_0_10_45_29]|nr:MAG: hypothetical protein COU37_02020 [Candidatus Micrarchaeota archaeon CG10_big_fil_rev_8_21_14_0_10_45_29]
MEPYLIEVSSEAGRKVGGIYTVLRSKARYSAMNFTNRYMFIGFYDERCAHDVKFSSPPKEMALIFESLAKKGIFCHYGNWIYGANTPIILVDAKNFSQKNVQYEDGGFTKNDLQVNYIKFILWKEFGIDSLMERSYDFGENVAWGWAVGMLLEQLCKIPPFSSSKAIAHFHEWICGSALLYACLKNIPCSTVFTTHATVLGRSLCASGADVLKKAQESSEPIEISEAYRLKVEGKHQLEMAAAKKCHVFSTVSESVAQEVRYILGKYPDAILLNGLDLEDAKKEFQVRNISKYVREELLQFAQSLFAPYYQSRFDNALLVFTSGRYEFTNKGFDIFISALGKLNSQLKKEGQKKQKQVIAFIFAPSATRGPKISIIKNYLLLDKITEILNSVPSASQQPHYPNALSRIEDVKSSLKRELLAMHSALIKDGPLPPACAFELNYSHDEVLSACKRAGLDNKEEDAVKIIFYPSYLKPNDGLLNLPYDDVISGMDAGIFPSRYEPFGYTPLEAGLRLNIAVSTDAAGFGRYLLSKQNLEKRGVKILKLSGGASHSSDELAQYVKMLYTAEPSELESLKQDSFQLMHLFDWKILISNYLKAYDLASERFSHPGKSSPSLQPPRPLLAGSKKMAIAASAHHGLVPYKEKSHALQISASIKIPAKNKKPAIANLKKKLSSSKVSPLAKARKKPAKKRNSSKKKSRKKN